MRTIEITDKKLQSITIITVIIKNNLITGFKGVKQDIKYRRNSLYKQVVT